MPKSLNPIKKKKKAAKKALPPIKKKKAPKKAAKKPTKDKPFMSTADSIKRGAAYRECIAMGGKDCHKRKAK